MGEVQGNAFIFGEFLTKPLCWRRMILTPAVLTQFHGSILHVVISVLVSVLALLAEINILWKSEKKNAG